MEAKYLAFNIFSSYIVFVFACRWKCSADCRFPDYLQTSDDEDFWEMRSPTGLYIQIAIKENEMLATECIQKGNREDEECGQTTAWCRKSFADDKFLVKVTDSPDESAVIFRCIQFFKRSRKVVQFKSSVFLKDENETLCSDTLLYTDVSPMIRIATHIDLPEEIYPCPFHGAYDLELYNLRRPCESLTATVHIKGECKPKRGMELSIGENECLKILPGLEGTANTIEFNCLATWVDTGIYGTYTYAFVKRKDTNADFWCLMIKFRDGYLFQMDMFRSVCTQRLGDAFVYSNEDLQLSVLKKSNESCPAFEVTSANKPTNTGSRRIFCHAIMILMMFNVF